MNKSKKGREYIIIDNKFIRRIGFISIKNKRNVIVASLILITILIQLSAAELVAQTPLDQWNADARTPVYSMYAASPSNSQNLIDQAYTFEFYRPKHGIVFGSQEGGHLSVAFEIISRESIRPQTRYFVKSMNVPPRINSSYSDYLTYQFKPYTFLEVHSKFKVYNSRFVVQELTLKNTVDNEVKIDVYPFFQHQKGIRDVTIGSDSTYFTFKHDEPMDGWGKRRNLPHPDSLYNVFLVSQKPRSFGAYSTLGPLRDDPTLPKARLADTSLKEGGPIHLEDGSLCMQAQPKTRMMVYRNDNRSKILTQKAPQVDGDTLNIPGDGTQQLELSHFNDPAIQSGDTFTVQLACQQQQGQATATVPENSDSVGVELNLSSDKYVAPPDSFKLEVGTGHETIFLSWNRREGYSYDIYRGLRSKPGEFSKVADSLTGSSFFDFGLQKYKSQTYVVVARDSTGNSSIPTKQEFKPLPPPPPQPAPPFFAHVDDSSSLSNEIYPYLKSVAGFQNRVTIKGNSSVTLRIIRGKGWARKDSLDQMINKAKSLLDYGMEQDLADTKQAYRSIPAVNVSERKKNVYWSAFNQLRQSVLPSEGHLKKPYLIETRDALKSWNKAGQSFYTSLSLLGLAMMDGQLAQSIQQNYFHVQADNGYIPHRIGPYITNKAPLNGENTSAAPWFSWVNWKIFQHTRDRTFLQNAYDAGRKFYAYWTNQRDSDSDGLSEWGGKAALESTRDGNSVIWDRVAGASEVEALDLNSILVKEARSLSDMAEKLGDSTAARKWTDKAEQRAQKIRDQFWSETDQFFYHIDRDDHDFTVTNSGDLKRKEIIGFLPLWADITTSSQADTLIGHLTDSQRFWRDHGVPSLAADDPFYNSVGRWNGPVWIPWQYFIYKGLKTYNRDELAQTLVDRVTNAVAGELVDVHTFKNRYSPDTDWAATGSSHSPTSVIARMIWESQGGTTPIEEDRSRRQETPDDYTLNQNYPNPFNPTTQISYSLPKTTKVTITVFTVTGRKVATLVDKRQQAGRHQVIFEAGHLSSGVYMYRLRTANYHDTRKMLLIK